MLGSAPIALKNQWHYQGGNKRKLSVCVALCANSRLVLFDEPTAGMDLSARRDVWQMLKNTRRIELFCCRLTTWMRLIFWGIALKSWIKES